MSKNSINVESGVARALTCTPLATGVTCTGTYPSIHYHAESEENCNEILIAEHNSLNATALRESASADIHNPTSRLQSREFGNESEI